ncbi:MAG: Autotransporter-associated beta strand repeat protein [Pedosphaera sp.]|nr:Autotransporter-associated beta strand repeat protein [Pedosphaera sp.]
MKINEQPAAHGTSRKSMLPGFKSLGAIISYLLIVVLMFGNAVNASAANLIWDAGNTNNGAAIDPASGSWNTDTTTNLNWNNGSGNVSWTQTSTTAPLMGSTFNGSDVADNTRQVVLDGVQIATTNLTIDASGYTFSGSPIYLNTLPNDLTAKILVADGKTVIFSNSITGNNGQKEFRLGNGSGAPATMVVYGNVTGGQPVFTSTNGGKFYLNGNDSAGQAHINANVYKTNGSFTATGTFGIGRRRPAPVSQPNNNTGLLVLDGPTTTFTQTGDYVTLARDGNNATGTLIIQNGATMSIGSVAQPRGLGLFSPNGSGATPGGAFFYMYGGTLNLGASGINTPILISTVGSAPGQIASMTQTGGVINAWGGILIGGGTVTGGSATITNSGGSLYIGSAGGNGIRFGAAVPTTNNISLSGGTMGALQSWISTVPLILDGNKGNFTFQCADAAGTSFDIALSGALTGPGGLNKTGPGKLTLTGANTYTGSTVVSNGTLVISTVNSPANGNVLVDGGSVAAGLPIVSNVVANTGQRWSINNLAFAAGTPTMSFYYNGFPPSTTVAAVQVNGNLAFTVTPNVVVDGTAIPVGTYPLIKYTGALSGTPPTALVSLPPGVTAASIVNNTANKSIDLQVTGSTVNPALKWLVGNGVWDTVTANWTQGGGPTLYTDNGTKDVVFDDTASGTSPVTVTVNTTINNPRSVTANNATKSYIVSGPGKLAGTNGLLVAGAGSLTLATTNTYSGGTTVNAPGRLNINYGGDGTSGSAIGTGTLTLNTGAKLDNTSGHSVVLNTAPPTPINWNDDWTFVGTTNLDLGMGQVTLGNLAVVLTVVSNTLTVNNPITDNTLGYSLEKTGNGELTLSNNNTFAGMTLTAGKLDVNADGAVGTGTFAINGGTLDNTSGSAVTLSTPSSINWGGNFGFQGTADLTLVPPVNIGLGGMVLTLNGTNTLTTQGILNGQNRLMIVAGTGNWVIAGDGNNNALSMTINGGTVSYAKGIGVAQPANTTTVNTNGTLVMLNPTGIQMGFNSSLVLGGGTVDLNRDSETILSVSFNSGILRNGASNGISTLTAANGITLGGISCNFEVVAVDNVLAIPSTILGAGSLTKTGAGTLQLTGTNTYTGSTVITAGTLALNDSALGGTIANSALINIGSGAALDVTGRSNQTLTLGSGQTLTGDGSINGNLAALAGSTVAPGASVGTLRVTNSITLGGAVLMELNRTNTQTSDQLVSVLGTITGGGTLTVTNLGPALQVGDVFHPFATGVSGFATINLPTTDASGNTYTWNNNIAANGSITVASVTPPGPTINPNPGTILVTASAGNLALAWPTNAGWKLQTNAAGLANTNAWFDYPGATAVTNVSIPVNTSKTNVFFRLLKP